ncbi:MAG TPA: SDR family oxidoreductase [Thermodesulfobacteriota bacterium]|nr:SDR family oxidoreductase [Thermodesulfobacteriota bacterium]
MTSKPILVTGATGYVGGRLVPKLLESGYRVRALGRSASKLKGRPWGHHPLVELAAGDVLDKDSLLKALEGCWAAFYLVHSMNAAPKTYSDADRLGAQNMVEAAAQAGLNRIIYLGGLGGQNEADLSDHLRSRHEVARILQSGSVPTTFLRAAMILGAGSASFELLRYLCDRLPVLIAPRWVNTPVQPIGIRNVLNYLQGCLEHDEVLGQTLDIGGPEIVTYGRLFQIYAEEAHLPKRIIIPVPFLTPRLSSYWIHLITPVPSSIARPLTEGLRNPVICRDNRIREIIPQELLTCRETIRLALERIKQQQVDTCWMDAGAVVPQEWYYCGDSQYAGGTILELGYRIVLKATPEEVWKPIVAIGGRTGWYFGQSLWKIRGWMDRLTGGIGLRGGRRHDTELLTGDALDFWRVLEVQPPNHLMLVAEMKVPGEALLEFKIKPLEGNNTELIQVARFLPRGLGGILYWYLFDPFHRILYPNLLKAIGKAVGKPVIQGPERLKGPQAQHPAS